MNSIAERSDRFIEVEGAINLRDFGGYMTADGRSVNRGMLFRCGLMTDIPVSAYEDFAALNLGVICDLRSQQEVDESPTPDAEPFHCRVHIPIWPGSSTQFHETARETRPTPGEFVDFMAQVTREIARDHVEAYKQLASELLNTERGFLLHCSAGKDRTGFGAAIILSMLGVDEETVMQDYLISNQASELAVRMKARMLEQMTMNGQPIPVNDEVVAIMSGVQQHYLQGAFAELEEHYGGVRGYLEAIGISAAEESELKKRLLD